MSFVLLTTAYFPNVQYFTKLTRSDLVLIEGCENYQKQSFRNRFDLYAANGPIALTVPVLKGRSQGLRIRDARISYETAWQRIHFKAVESAYRHAPFYEFLIDDLKFVWEEKETFLLDMNQRILQTLLDLMQWTGAAIRLTDTYEMPTQEIDTDWRYRIHPKIPFTSDPSFTPRPYYQVFRHKEGFQPNLSILDTLFQLGPETLKYVNDCASEPESDGTGETHSRST